MTDDELDDIRRRALHDTLVLAIADRNDLLAEVDRLRASLKTAVEAERRACADVALRHAAKVAYASPEPQKAAMGSAIDIRDAILARGLKEVPNAQG